ncbi:hypothetical protein AWB75_06238 [Caballeronia catudaia]|uniref:Uncharacterized protein n=1 Tax=Caballeronia catudaia TaxID=1777136 RepID=A0A158D5T7_9BURK|nr:hypothetical protein [Caballeronia catudaia]SAK89881.1 hypothetical protein AWB75_06238 [Caballeronia catudaia]
MSDASLKAWAAKLGIDVSDALLAGVAALLDTMQASASQLAVALAETESEAGDEPRG